MTKQWETKKLGEVCEIGAGNSAPQKKDLFDGGKYPFFRTSDVGRIRFGVIHDSTDKLNEIGIKRLHLYKKGTLLFPKSGASTFSNHRVLMATDGYVSSHLATLKAKDNILDDRFLLYYSSTIDSRNLMQDQNYPSLRLSDIQEIGILLPSYHEQKRIVKILDDVFEKTAKAKEIAEKNLQNAQELFESYLQSVFANPGYGWEEKKLNEVCEISSKLIDPREEPYVDQCHVGGANIESITGRLIDLKTSREEKLISGKFTFNNLMVLYSKIRPYLVKVARPDFSGLCSADIYPLKPVASILDKNFLYFLLITKDFTNFAIKGSARAGMPKVNREHLFSYSNFFPSLTEQKLIVAKLDALLAETKKLEAIYQKKLADLEELKKSILKKAFNGELTGACS